MDKPVYYNHRQDPEYENPFIKHYQRLMDPNFVQMARQIIKSVNTGELNTLEFITIEDIKSFLLSYRKFATPKDLYSCWVSLYPYIICVVVYIPVILNSNWVTSQEEQKNLWKQRSIFFKFGCRHTFQLIFQESNVLNY